ncbi:MAG TPA: hypothetical protein VMY17_00050, partial [Thermoplasmata archaeon]|nr:hypothetical protein [Thermoplasmata archaeon]
MVDESKAPQKERNVKAKASASKKATPEEKADVAVPKEDKTPRGRGMYHYIGEAWKNPSSPDMKALMWQRLIDWRKEESF